MFSKKNINLHLLRKFKDWEKSIKDEKVKKLVNENTIITGGAIASLLLGEKVNDYDVYFTNRETCQAVAEYYVNKFNKLYPKGGNPTVEINEDGRVNIKVQSQGITSIEADKDDYAYFELQSTQNNGQDFADNVINNAREYVNSELNNNVSFSNKNKKAKDYDPLFMSSNAITLKGGIQVVIRFYGEPEEIHKNFDFVHCKNYWTSKNQDVILVSEALESILAKELQYTGSLYPLASLMRIRKFIKRGWNINAGQILKMSFQVSQLDLTEPTVLYDQLVGVDFAYFSEIINLIIADIKSNPSKEIDNTYLSNIIDSIF